MIGKVDVAIIGGGIFGASAAYHLARDGRYSVALFEKGRLGSGSSGKSAAIVRDYYATEIMLRSAVESRRIFENFEREVGEPIEYVKNTELILEGEENRRSASEKATLMKKAGLRADVYGQDELKRKFSYINPEGIGLAIHDLDAGFVVSPVKPILIYAREAARLGCRVYENSKVSSIVVEKGSIRSVVTDKGEVRARYVVNTAGPWAAHVGKMVGVDIPVKAERQQVIDLKPRNPWPLDRPTIADRKQLIYVKPTRNGLAHCGAHYLGRFCDPNEIYKGVERDFVFRVAPRAVHRLPGLQESSIVRGFSGFYEMTPDTYPILCSSKEVDGFIVAAGFSGHGYKHGPFFGRLIKELIGDGKTSIDIHILRLERFKTGDLLEASRTEFASRSTPS